MESREHFSTFLVEQYRPGVDVEHLGRCVASLQTALRDLERHGTPVHFLCSVIVPGDESILVVVDAASEQLVQDAYVSAGMAYDRISVAIAETAGNPTTPREPHVADVVRVDSVAHVNPSISTPPESERNQPMQNMKRTVIAAATLVAAIAAGTTATGALAGGAGGPSQSKVVPIGQQLNGTWQTTVTLSDAPPGIDTTFLALDTFLPGGGLLVSSSASGPNLRSLAHGTWVRTGNRRFSSTFSWFRFDPTGKFAGTQRVRRTISLGADLKSFQSVDVIEIIAPTGAVVATIHGTEQGTVLEG